MVKALSTAAIVLLLATGAAGAQSADAPSSEAVQALAPGGRLRAAINTGNLVLVQKDAAGGEPHGITVDLAHELGRRLGVPVDLVVYDAAGKVTAAATTNAWDIAFVAIEPARAAEIGFSAPYLIIEGTYMVPADSPLKTVADADRPGTRIGVSKGSAYDLYLSRTLKNATLVRYPSPPASLDGFVADKLDAAAGVRQQLTQFAASHPGFRVMADRFQEIRQAMGTPRDRPAAGLRYLKSFVEDVKASGFVAAALERSHQADAAIAPPARE